MFEETAFRKCAPTRIGSCKSRTMIRLKPCKNVR